MAKNHKYEKFKKNVELLKKEFYRAYVIAKIVNIDKGVFSKYINGEIIPGDDTLNKFNAILEEQLLKVKTAKKAKRAGGTKKQAKEIADLKAEMVELHKKVDRFIALLEKKN